MLTVQGITRKKGEYEGIAYDNIYLHCLNDYVAPKNHITGQTCEILKVKAAQVGEVFGGVIKTDADWRDLVGCKINAYYDRYGNAQQISFVDNGNTK